MTPDQAAQLITAALQGPNDHATDAARELAERLAIALDAIGLLAFAVDPQWRGCLTTGQNVPPNVGSSAPPGATLDDQRIANVAWAENRKRP